MYYSLNEFHISYETNVFYFIAFVYIPLWWWFLYYNNIGEVIVNGVNLPN